MKEEKKESSYPLWTLSNGLRVVYHHLDYTPLTHIGLLIDLGSRDEDESEEGLAHFIEHMLFKGTKHRNATHIINKIENIGGDLNAFTSKDKLGVHASLLTSEAEKAFELIQDIVFNSVFPEKEIEKEKSVIIEEIDYYEDTPDEKILEEFQELYYENHPLAHKILGSKNQVLSFTKEKILQFHQKHFILDRMVLSICGSLKQPKAEKFAEKHFGHLKTSKNQYSRKDFVVNNAFENIIDSKFQQAHVVCGYPTINLNDPRKETLVLLNNILGGPGANARLNMELREKKALTYHIDSSYNLYEDGGLLLIYWSTDTNNFSKSLKAVKQQLQRFKNHQISPTMLGRYKKQLEGQLALGDENNLALMLGMAKNILQFNKIYTREEFIENINSLSSLDIQKLAEEIFTESNLSLLAFRPN